ncbi:threalose-6-phosphate phosphatase [Neophaeococcomyces mojaviensis]|uniref:Threalose-6-phosphate phosphatase n=1 Tax=Neophaeococcomyces mojaviensis TaxID=3383035 RepID=A0ACC3AIR4_9EURO|nr:threalose-6-phosphate phosphatase [Knufia sp. JES_112]
MLVESDPSGASSTTSVKGCPQLLRSDRVFLTILRDPAADSNREMITDSENVDIKKGNGFEKLGMTGRIISVVPQLPSVIAVSKNNEAQLSPRPSDSSIYNCLEYLSTTSQCEHTIVGWTGEIFSTGDPELTNPSASESHYPRRSSEDDKFIQCAASTQKKIEDNLVATHKNCEIVPIWLGENSAAIDRTIMLGDQKRWTRFTDELVRPVLHNDYPTLLQNFHSGDTVSSETIQKYYDDHKTIIGEYVKAVLKVYKPGDIIWIHDYQLMLLSNELRQQLPDAHIVYFQHTNWPTNNFFEVLPEWKSHISGILGASMIGVQHQDSKDQVLELCNRKTAVQDKSADTEAEEIGNKIVVVPTGYYFAAAHGTARKQGQAYEKLSELKTILDGKNVVAAYARLDNVEGIRAVLKGLDHFLKKHPQSSDEVALVLITTAGEVPHVADSKDKGLSKSHHPGDILSNGTGSSELAGVTTEDRTESLINKIKNELGPEIFSSVIPQYISLSQYLTLLRSAKLGLVTTHDSGVNATVMEFAACQENKHSPLLLSNLSCTDRDFGEKDGVIAVDLLDPESLSNGIVQGFNMDADEKRNRHQKLSNQVKHISIAKWVNMFLSKACKKFALDASKLNMEKLGKAYAESPKRLLVFDYDGTLTPLVNDPEAAIPTQSVLESIVRLSSDPKTELWLVSGRSKVFLEKHFGHIKSVGLSAEHGCFMRQPGAEEWISLAESMDMGWHAVAGKVFDRLAMEVPGSEVERKEVAIVWHYRNADQAVGLRVAKEKQAELETELRNWDVEVGLGSNILEVKPKSLNKGVIVSRLVDEIFDSEKGFVFCAGDDTTDEGEFEF